MLNLFCRTEVFRFLFSYFWSQQSGKAKIRHFEPVVSVFSLESRIIKFSFETAGTLATVFFRSIIRIEIIFHWHLVAITIFRSLFMIVPTIFGVASSNYWHSLRNQSFRKWKMWMRSSKSESRRTFTLLTRAIPNIDSGIPEHPQIVLHSYKIVAFEAFLFCKIGSRI